MKGDITKIYGVDLVGSQDPNALKRTDDADGLTITVGPSEIDSSFDDCYPWSDIEEVTDEFGNVFIKIPKFYSKITKNSYGTYKHQLSGTKYEGFDTLFKVGNREIDYIMVGKYEGSGSTTRVYSHTNTEPLTGANINDYRLACQANGDGYQQYDLVIDCIIKELWLVEMKTTDVQSIMKGCTTVFDGGPQVSGTTDGVGTPTSSGSPENNGDGKHACKYRGIENPWGNINKWVDGIDFDSSSFYVCTEPDEYRFHNTWESISYPYVAYKRQWNSSGYVTAWGPVASDSVISFISSVSSQSSAAQTNYCDWASNGGGALACGGSRSSRNHAGLWCYARDLNGGVGGRLCYKPPLMLPKIFNPLRNKMVCSISRKSGGLTTQHTTYGWAPFELKNGKQEAFYLQPESWVDAKTGDLTQSGDIELEYLNYPHPFKAQTGELLEYDNLYENINTKNQRTIGECCLQPIATLGWQPQVWTGLTSFSGSDVWTDGVQVYYSGASKQYQLEPHTSVWVPKKWQGVFHSLYDTGDNIWTDGTTTYYSKNSDQYELVSNTSTWISKTWNGFTPTGRKDIWTDGANIYYSNGTQQYQLDKTTSTWSVKKWYGLTVQGQYIWTDGDNIYYSSGAQQYQLDRSTSTWSKKGWSGFNPNGDCIWTDGENIYYSFDAYQYQLDKTTDTWVQKDWGEPTKFYGFDIWVAAGCVYCSEGDKQYKLQVPKTNQYNVWTDCKRIQIDTPAGPRVVQTTDPATWDDTKYWVEGWDENTDTHMVQVKRHPQLTNKTLKIDCYMKNIDDLYTGLDTCTLSYENDPDGNSGTWYLKRGDSTYITLKVTQTQKQEGQS